MERRNELLDLANSFLQQNSRLPSAESANSCIATPTFNVLREDQHPTPGLLTDRQGGSHSFAGMSGRQSDIDDDCIGRELGYPYQ